MIIFRKAILIIHGFAGGTYDEEGLDNYLELDRKFDVFSFTLPGHDKTIIKNVTRNDWINKCNEMIDMLINNGYKTIYVIGHSMGGVLACNLASKYKQIKKVVLLAPAFEYLVFDNSKLKVIESASLAPKLFKEYESDTIISRIIKIPIKTIIEFTKLVEENRDCIKDIKVPVLIVHGDKDDIVNYKSSENIKDKFGTSNVSLIKATNINHDIIRSSKVQIVNKIIKKFLKKKIVIKNNYEI
ncbi:MAG TPA: alpha/beta fold hydrolase [Bacilli bacterium]|mgnify:CR=1 FL=1|nr:alpha/beta fold hydrolase [Bacilli bacterium]